MRLRRPHPPDRFPDQMPTDIAIADLPDDIVQRLRERAARNHRSLQGELRAIIEDSVKLDRVKIDEYRARIRALGLRSRSEAAAIVRADRDVGHRSGH